MSLSIGFLITVGELGMRLPDNLYAEDGASEVDIFPPGASPIAYRDAVGAIAELAPGSVVRFTGSIEAVVFNCAALGVREAVTEDTDAGRIGMRIVNVDVPFDDDGEAGFYGLYAHIEINTDGDDDTVDEVILSGVVGRP